jgi:hypothetical protein
VELDYNNAVVVTTVKMFYGTALSLMPMLLSLCSCNMENLTLFLLCLPPFCGKYYKNITIVKDTYRVIKITIISVAPSCGVTSDHSRGVIYAPREH